MDNQEYTPDMMKRLLKDNTFTQIAKSFLGSSSDKSKAVNEALNTRDIDAESVKPKLTTKKTASEFIKNKKAKTDDEPSVVSKKSSNADPSPSTVMDVIVPFMDLSLDYSGKREISTYTPSSLMMFEIIHNINDALVDSRSFQRNCPDYHPYILRLYGGVLFWIQCLRVGAHANILSDSQLEFLTEFLEHHPLESLYIPSPLLPVFKTLCASQPEYREFGHLLPIVPKDVGPNPRSSFIIDRPESFALPNVPGILALITDLENHITRNQAEYPLKGAHDPLSNTLPVVLGGHNFPIPNERSNFEKWSLVTPGIEWPCEATKKLNEVFAERLSSYNFPLLNANDDLTEIRAFLNMDRSRNWFFRCKDVAERISTFMKNSGTLADCPVFGCAANQYLIQYIDTPDDLPAPTKVADRNSCFPLSYYATTSVSRKNYDGTTSLPIACIAQTNVVMPANHPYAAAFGLLGETRFGHFWRIAPINYSAVDLEGHSRLRSIVLNLAGTDK